MSNIRTLAASSLVCALILASCNQAPPAATLTPSAEADPVSATQSTAGGGVSAGSAFTPPAGAAQSGGLSAQAIVNCSSWTYNGTAQALCTIKSGQARVRADCTLYPDLYSPWTGKGTWSLWTGKCPFGIRSAIIETRY